MAMMEKKKDTSRTRRSFPDEFKTDAVAMVLDDGRKIVDVAEAIGVGHSTLGNWVRLEGIERGERAGLTRDDRTEIVELRKENARLRMERDPLERAAAFWVKEPGQWPATSRSLPGRSRDSRKRRGSRATTTTTNHPGTKRPHPIVNAIVPFRDGSRSFAAA